MSSVSITKSRAVDDHVASEGIYGYVTVQKYTAATGTWETIDQHHPNLLTTEGRDFFHAQVYTNTSAAGTRGSRTLLQYQLMQLHPQQEIQHLPQRFQLMA